MGLPIGSSLDANARQQFERRFARVLEVTRIPFLGAFGSVAALLEEAFFGFFRAGLKAVLVGVGAIESIRRMPSSAGRTLSRLVPRMIGSLIAAVLFMSLAKLLAAIQTLLRFEPPGRPLSTYERRILRMVFHESLDLEPLRIKRGSCGLASVTSRPFVHGHVLYLHDCALDPCMLVHEAVHWWQYQYGGSDYIFDSLWSQSFGKGYDWEVSFPTVSWEDLETEQQAQLVEDAFRFGFFETGCFMVNGKDMGTRFEDMLDTMRAGHGAP